MDPFWDLEAVLEAKEVSKYRTLKSNAHCRSMERVEKEKESKNENAPLQPVLLPLPQQICQHGLHDPLIGTQRPHRLHVLLTQPRPRDLTRELRERDGVEDDDGEEVRFEAVAVDEELLDEGVGGVDVLDLFERYVFALGEFHYVLFGFWVL